MKVYALLATIGDTTSFKYDIYGITHASSIEKACQKFRVTPTPERSAYGRAAIRDKLPLPPKSENPEFLQVDPTEDSVSELGHTLSIPRLHSFMINVGTWVCEVPVVD